MTVVSEGYKEIKVGGNPTAEPVIVDISLDEPVVEVKQDEPVDQVVEVKPERKPSRSEKRIKDLVSKNHDAEFRAFQAEQRATELEKRLLAGNVSSKESLKGQLEEAITSIATQLDKAYQNGDNAEIIRLQSQLIDAKVEAKSLATELKDNYKEVEEAKVRHESPRQTQQQVSEKANEWIESYPEFKTDDVFRAAAIAINNQLLREGFDPNQDEFYEELSQRSAKRFPEVFGVPQQTSVSLSNRDDSPEADEGVKVAAPVPKTQKARTTEQVVSGSSRPSANVIQKKNSTEVTLSAQDVEQANIWGLDLKQMARRIAHSETNKRTDGYVPIAIPKS